MGYALLNHLFAEYLGYEPGELVYMGNDAHIYSNQFDMVEEQLQRTPHDLPQLKILKRLNTLDDLLELEYNDVQLENYVAEPDIKNKPKMAV
jgi:thymidylate synthase